MAISVEDLEKRVLDNTTISQTVTIISGFFSADVIEDIAKCGKPLNFYYGMYTWNGITVLQQSVFKNLEAKYSNLKIYIVFDYHVHTKCYIFHGTHISSALVGSANCSSNGLLSDKNCEMLADISDPALVADLDAYAAEVHAASLHFDDPSIIPYKRSASKRVSTSKGRIYSGNPFITNIPLYIYKNRKKYVPPKSGINWGLQKGNTKAVSPYVEAYIPIKEFDLKYNAAMIPVCGSVGAGSGGKKTRRLSPVTVTWDDGTVMQMLFQGTQEYPGKRTRKPGDPFMIYPKQLSTDKGGALLGEYLRKRMGIPGRKTVTISDFRKYGRDYITLTYISPGNYEADFS